MLKYETAESKLRNSEVPLANTVLALQLLDRANLTSDQRSNVLTHVKIENTDTVYDDMKASLRLFKGSLVENNKAVKDDEEEEVNYNKNNYRSRSKSNQRIDKSNLRFDDQSFGRRDPQNQRRDSRERGRSRNRNQSQDRSAYFRRDRSKSRDYSQHRYGRSRSGNKYENVNLVFKESGNDAQIETEDNFDKMVVDSGTTKTVAGHQWMENYLDTLPPDEKNMIEKHSEQRFFRFGNSVRYPSNQEVVIPIKLGRLEEKLYISVVNAAIPLLIGKPDLKRFGFVIDFEEETVFTSSLAPNLPL